MRLFVPLAIRTGRTAIPPIVIHRNAVHTRRSNHALILDTPQGRTLSVQRSTLRGCSSSTPRTLHNIDGSNERVVIGMSESSSALPHRSVDVPLEGELNMAIAAAGYLRRRYSKLQNIKNAEGGAKERERDIAAGSDHDCATGTTLSQLRDILVPSTAKHASELSLLVPKILDRYNIATTVPSGHGGEYRVLLHEHQINMLSKTNIIRMNHDVMEKKGVEDRIDEIVREFVCPLLEGVWGLGDCLNEEPNRSSSVGCSDTSSNAKGKTLREIRHMNQTVPMSTVLAWLQWNRMIPIGQDALRYSMERVFNQDNHANGQKGVSGNTRPQNVFYFDSDDDVVRLASTPHTNARERVAEDPGSSTQSRFPSVPKQGIVSRAALPVPPAPMCNATPSTLPQVVLFDDILAEVLRGKQMAAIAAFANFVIRTIFFEVIPCMQQVRPNAPPSHSSVASQGMYIGRLAKRLRWQAETTEDLLRFSLSDANTSGASMPPPPLPNSPSARLGSLRSFLEFFDGVFFEMRSFELERRREEGINDSKGESSEFGPSTLNTGTDEEDDGDVPERKEKPPKRPALFPNQRLVTAPPPPPPPLLMNPFPLKSIVSLLVYANVQELETHVSVYRGAVGSYLLYSRVARQLFPADVPVPLGVLAQSLLWSQIFAPRFGELLPLLKLVGRKCGNGFLVPVSASHPLRSSTEHSELSEPLKTVHSISNDVLVLRELANVGGDDTSIVENKFPLERLFSGAGDLSEKQACCSSLAGRFPFHLKTVDENANDTDTCLLRVGSLQNVALEQRSNLASFVYTYIVPVLRRSSAFEVKSDVHGDGECGRSVITFGQPLSRLQACLRWDELDNHPAVTAMGLQRPCRYISLLGILVAYQDIQSEELTASGLSPTPQIRVHLVRKSTQEEISWSRSSQLLDTVKDDFDPSDIEPYITYGSYATSTGTPSSTASFHNDKSEHESSCDMLNAEDGLLAANGLEAVVESVPKSGIMCSEADGRRLNWRISLVPTDQIVSLVELCAEACELQDALQPFYPRDIAPHARVVENFPGRSIGCIPVLHPEESMHASFTQSSIPSVIPNCNVSSEEEGRKNGASSLATLFTDLLVYSMDSSGEESSDGNSLVKG